ncbi:hypothetical protein MTO96_002533 [Rhipicephalus appendiculatus]
MRAALQLLVAATHLLVATQAHYLNAWAVRIRGGRQVADQLAYELGYANVGPVVWAEQQMVRPREKRGLPSDWETLRFNDPLWSRQWYIHDTRSSPELPELDHRVTKVWDMGFTGRGIVVTVMDDGLEWNHTDLVQNYAPEASYDFNDDDRDPFPRYDSQDLNKGDNCNCDGYAGSPYTLSVSGASQRGRFPYYGEKCASTMAAAYSSGAYTDQKVSTSDLHDRCTTQHTGTSASAPLGRGHRGARSPGKVRDMTMITMRDG